MITLDQVFLLEQKVESAVKKIEQLQAENDALNKKVEELKNALSSKSEQLTSFESDQTQIENGIKKALDRLAYIENTIINSVSSNGSSVSSTTVNTVNTNDKPMQVEEVPVIQPTFSTINSNDINSSVTESQNKSVPSFDDMNALDKAFNQSVTITKDETEEDFTNEPINNDTADNSSDSFTQNTFSSNINNQNSFTSESEKELEETLNFDISTDAPLTKATSDFSNNNFFDNEDEDTTDDTGFDIF